MTLMSPSSPRIIELPKYLDDRGNLSFFENRHHIPFDVQRVYMIYDVPGGEIRGGHAFHEQEQFLISLSGSFEVITDNGKKQERFRLNRSYYGLYIPKMIWWHLEEFSTNAVCLCAASTMYLESDYIRDYPLFQKLSQ